MREHFRRKKYNSIFWGKKRIFDQNLQIYKVLKISISSLGYQPVHTKKPFRDEMFLEISVREKCTPLGKPTCFVLWQF